MLPPDEEESAIGGLVVQAAWLQLNLIEAGFFVRGGLSLGLLHLRDGLVFGPALADAYELESDKAVHPRIVLSRPAAKSQHDDLTAYADPRESAQQAMLMRDGDGWSFINYLGLLFDEPEDPRPALAMHRDRVVECLSRHRGTKRVWEKYRWLAEYHNHVVMTRLPGSAELLVAASLMTWEFVSFV